MNTAQSVRLAREKHPERYCSKCLWNTARSGPCPRHHPVAPVTRERCEVCGAFRDRDTGNGYHQAFESGHEANSANPSGTVPYWEKHNWVDA